MEGNNQPLQEETCVVCGKIGCKARGNCGRCYQQNTRLMLDAFHSHQRITWDDLIAAGRAKAKRRGRPPATKELLTDVLSTLAKVTSGKRKSGRPKGSRNKPRR